MTTEGSIMGKEQLILLPHMESHTFTLETDDSATVELHTGPLAVVFSGHLAAGNDPANPGFWLNGVDDDDQHETEILGVVGPVWRDLSQASASVSIAGIYSFESDEVDHSEWWIKKSSWDLVDEDGGKRLRLRIVLVTRGDENGWANLAYQVVATGMLMRMPRLDEVAADI